VNNLPRATVAPVKSRLLSRNSARLSLVTILRFHSIAYLRDAEKYRSMEPTGKQHQSGKRDKAPPGPKLRCKKKKPIVVCGPCDGKAGKTDDLQSITAYLPELEVQFARLKGAMNEFANGGK